jgi:hypothetical protein
VYLRYHAAPMLLEYYFLTRNKRTERDRGRALMFCPVCRRPQFMHAVVVTVKRGLGRPEDSEEARCPECELSFGPFRRGDLPTELPYSGRLEDDIELLPGPAAAALRSRVNIEAALIAGTLTAEQRAWMIRQPFRALAHAHSGLITRPSPAHSVSAVLQFVAIVGILAAAMLWYVWVDARPTEKNMLLGWASGTSLVAGVASILALYRQVFWKRIRVRPLLGTVREILVPLSPSAGELESALADLRREKNSLARSLRLRDLVQSA